MSNRARLSLIYMPIAVTFSISYCVCRVVPLMVPVFGTLDTLSAAILSTLGLCAVVGRSYAKELLFDTEWGQRLSMAPLGRAHFGLSLTTWVFLKIGIYIVALSSALILRHSWLLPDAGAWLRLVPAMVLFWLTCAAISLLGLFSSILAERLYERRPKCVALILLSAINYGAWRLCYILQGDAHSLLNSWLSSSTSPHTPWNVCAKIIYHGAIGAWLELGSVTLIMLSLLVFVSRDLHLWLTRMGSVQATASKAHTLNLSGAWLKLKIPFLLYKEFVCGLRSALAPFLLVTWLITVPVCYTLLSNIVTDARGELYTLQIQALRLHLANGYDVLEKLRHDTANYIALMFTAPLNPMIVFLAVFLILIAFPLTSKQAQGLWLYRIAGKPPVTILRQWALYCSSLGLITLGPVIFCINDIYNLPLYIGILAFLLFMPLLFSACAVAVAAGTFVSRAGHEPDSAEVYFTPAFLGGVLAVAFVSYLHSQLIAALFDLRLARYTMPANLTNVSTGLFFAVVLALVHTLIAVIALTIGAQRFRARA